MNVSAPQYKLSETRSWMTGIDHPVIAVRSMSDAHAQFERLGFTIPPRGSHLEWGTGNWCIMFPDDYLELRGVIKDGYTHNLEALLLERGEGLMGLALGSADAEASRRALIERGFHPQPVRGLTRNFELPGGWLQPRFSLCFLDEVETGGLMSVVFCQHLTPELLRRPEWLEHANGAVGIASITGTTDDVERSAAVFARLFGDDAVSRKDDRIVVDAGRGSIMLGTVADICEQYPECRQGSASASPRLLVVTLKCRDAKQAQELFNARRIAHRVGENGQIVTSSEEACGVVLEFVGLDT